MKIAIFTDTYPPQINGVATSTYNLAKTLKAHGHEVIIVMPNLDTAKFEFEDGIVKVPGFVLKHLYGYRGTWIYSSKGFQIVKQFQPDVIHCQTDAPIGQFAKICARKIKTSFVYTYHTQYEDYTYIVTHGYFDRVAKKAIRSYSVHLSKFSQEFITPSVKTKEMLRHYGADNYISVIPTGIDFSLFKKENLDLDEYNQIRANLGIDDDTFVFLILGRLAKEKSMDISIRGFAKFTKTYPDIKTKLVIVGGGPAQSELEMIVDKCGIRDLTTFVGPVNAPKVPLYYHLADVYTSASVTETQGLTFMEAMSSGAIVIARFDDNLTGTIEDNETGYFFTNEDGFVEKAYKVYTSTPEEKKRIINNAYKIIEQYSIETFYNNIMEVYTRAVKSYW